MDTALMNKAANANNEERSAPMAALANNDAGTATMKSD
jgi:hypothetical protein